MNIINFEVEVDPDNFLSMNTQDRELLVSSLAEAEKFANLMNFKTLPDGKVGWNPLPRNAKLIAK